MSLRFWNTRDGLTRATVIGWLLFEECRTCEGGRMLASWAHGLPMHPAVAVLMVQHSWLGTVSSKLDEIVTFHQKPLFIKNHFHQKPLSSKTTFIKNHFHQKPLSSKTTFIKTTFIKNHFHQKPLSSKTTFIKNHFHQKPL